MAIFPALRGKKVISVISIEKGAGALALRGFERLPEKVI
jgi:hypothetical protein